VSGLLCHESQLFLSASPNFVAEMENRVIVVLLKQFELLDIRQPLASSNKGMQ